MPVGTTSLAETLPLDAAVLGEIVNVMSRPTVRRMGRMIANADVSDIE